VHALTVMQLWRWFLVPLGVPAITFVHAFGLDLLCRALTGGAHRELLFTESYDAPSEMTEEEKFERSKRDWARVIVNLAMWLFLLGLGYAAHRLM
jgi:hypothetical protein